MIRKEGDKWILYTKDGKKKLGEFDSEKAAEKREREIQFFKHNKAGIEEIEFIITKASQQDDGTMRWQATVSDTDRDSADEQTSLALFRDWIARVETGKGVDFLPPPHPPFLGVSHYPSLDGEGVAGVTEKMYIDGRQFKASGRFLDTPLGHALFRAVRAELDTVKRGGTVEKPIRISAAWWDLEHSHGDFVFTRRSLTQMCSMCVQGAGNKQYLKGQPDHWAGTRVPINPRTALELEEKSMAKVTRQQDAASIVGDELAGELEEKSRQLVGKSEAEELPDGLVVKAEDEEPPVLDGEPDVEKAVETTEDYVRVRVKSTNVFAENAFGKGEKFRTIDIDKKAGVKAVIGKPKGKETTEVQVYLFDKEKWTESKAQKWVAEHEKKTKAAVEQMAHGMGDEHEYRPLGGATSFADAEAYIETQQKMDRLYNNWDVFRMVLDNILSSPDDVDKIGAFSAAVKDFGSRVDALKARVADAYLLRSAAEAVLVEEGERPAPTIEVPQVRDKMEVIEMTDQVTQQAAPPAAEQPATAQVAAQASPPPAANDPLAQMGTTVKAALGNPALSREAKAQAIQEAFNSYGETVKAQLDAVAPPPVGEEIAAAITKSLQPLLTFGEKLDLVLARLAQPAPQIAAPGQPQQKSWAPGQQPVLNTGGQGELPVSPITGQPSKLRALVQRSVQGGRVQ